MSEYKVEDGIPIPSKMTGPGRSIGEFRQKLKTLQVGQSILYGKSRSGVHTICKKIKKETGFMFTARKVDGGVRVWRIL